MHAVLPGDDVSVKLYFIVVLPLQTSVDGKSDPSQGWKKVIHQNLACWNTTVLLEFNLYLKK